MLTVWDSGLQDDKGKQEKRKGKEHHTEVSERIVKTLTPGLPATNVLICKMGIIVSSKVGYCEDGKNAL